MSDLVSPIWVTLLIALMISGSAATRARMPFLSAKVWAGSTTSASAMMDGVMNRSMPTTNSKFMSAL